MGMFDTVRDGDHEVQTKAFGRSLGDYTVGDRVDVDGPATCAVAALGGPDGSAAFTDAWILIQDNVIVGVVTEPPDDTYPRVAYSGGLATS